MNSEDEKHQKMMKAVSVFYSDAANAESVFGRPVTDIERHIFRIGANLFRNLKNDTLPITGFIHSVAFDPILSECNGEDFCNDEFSMLAARNAAWHAIKSAIKKGELIIRDGLSMVPVNELPSVLNWCAADSPGLDQVSANFVVKTDEARRWLEASGMPIPEWMVQSNDSEIADDSRSGLSGVVAKTDVAWIADAKEIFKELRHKYPDKDKKFMAQKIRERLHEKGIRGRGGKLPSVETIRRRATQNMT
jgi:hypothetical protein